MARRKGRLTRGEGKEGKGGGEHTKEPMAPLPGVGIKAVSATRAVRTLHDGCQCSGWCEEMERQILVLVWKRPLGVSIMKEGGFMGYSGGRMMRPW
jgi:hypothetical protein